MAGGHQPFSTSADSSNVLKLIFDTNHGMRKELPSRIIYMLIVSRSDGIPAELFKILKDDAIKVLHSMSANLENAPVATGLEKISLHPNSQEGQY